MKQKNIFILIILYILLILIKGYIFSTKYIADDYLKEYTVFIESIKAKSDTKISYNVRLLNTNDKFILNIYDDSYDDKQTDLTNYSNYKYSDVIKVKGKIQIPQKLNNPGEFDYKLYLYSNKIYGLINTYEIPTQIKHSPNITEKVYSKIYKFKDYAQDLIKSSMNETHANVACSMIYGDTLELDETIQEDFEAVGVSHLMSVSGTHITSFILVINMVLGIKKNSKRKKNTKNKIKETSKDNITKIVKGIIQIVCIYAYMIFTGLGVSVLRAGLMLIIYIICDMFSKKKNKYLAFSITLLIIIAINPFVIFNTGAKLSFLATLGIVLLYSHIQKFFEKLTGKITNEVVKKILIYIFQNISITMAVQLLIIPIQIQAFNKLPFPILFPNLVLGIISSIIRVVGTIGIMLSFLPVISCKIFSFLEPIVQALVFIAKIFKNISFSISTVSQGPIFFVLYYTFILVIYIYFKIKDIYNKSKNGNNNTKYDFKSLIKYLKIFQIILLVLVITLVISTNVYSIYYSKYVYFFNVEQGDMSYIKCGMSSVIVDIGSLKTGLAFNTISNYFKISNLKKVDVIVISHMHQDHVNGLENMLKKYDVGQVLYSKPKEENDSFKNFKNMLEKYNVESKEVKAGEIVDVGKIKIEVLLPDEKYIVSSDEINANSLICKITVNDKTLLYMGDASMDTEEKLIQKYENEDKDKKINLKDIYILKVGHHGSKTATSRNFIQFVQPQNAVISACKRYYGHPHENTVDVLKQNNVYTYLTEKQGAIKFSLN